MRRSDAGRSGHPIVQDLDARRRQAAWRLLARGLLLLLVGAGWSASSPGAAHAEDRLRYADLSDGTSALWVDAGGYAHWITERAPLDAAAPLVLGLGFSHALDAVRLSWRARLLTGTGDAAPRFLLVDFVGLERLLAEGTVRPWWRLALGFGLDLRGAVRDLGTSGYFNADNGAAGGLSIAAGGGVDVVITERLFVRAEASLRVHGAAGRTGVVGIASAGPGVSW